MTEVELLHVSVIENGRPLTIVEVSTKRILLNWSNFTDLVLESDELILNSSHSNLYDVSEQISM